MGWTFQHNEATVFCLLNRYGEQYMSGSDQNIFDGRILPKHLLRLTIFYHKKFAEAAEGQDTETSPSDKPTSKKSKKASRNRKGWKSTLCTTVDVSAENNDSSVQNAPVIATPPTWPGSLLRSASLKKWYASTQRSRRQTSHKVLLWEINQQKQKASQIPDISIRSTSC